MKAVGGAERVLRGKRGGRVTITPPPQNKQKKKVFKNGTQQLAVATFHLSPDTGTLHMINTGTRWGVGGGQVSGFVLMSSPGCSASHL